MAKQQIEGIYSFRFKNKVYTAQVKATAASHGYYVLAKRPNTDWALVATVPFFEIAQQGSKDWSEWRKRVRLLVAKHFGIK